MSDSEIFWDFCETHQRREPSPAYGHAPAYKSCRSCFHTWLEEDEFLADVEYLNSRLGLKGHPGDELICPLCSNFF